MLRPNTQQKQLPGGRADFAPVVVGKALQQYWFPGSLEQLLLHISVDWKQTGDEEQVQNTIPKAHSLGLHPSARRYIVPTTPCDRAARGGHLFKYMSGVGWGEHFRLKPSQEESPH